MHYDAIIIGARCAGAATAMQLARGGMKVLLLDRAQKGSDTMSTHALMRGAVMQLEQWGLLDRVIASGAPEVSRTRFSYGGEVIDVPIRPAHRTQGLIAPRRYILDAILQEAAADAGAEMQFGKSFVDVVRDKNGAVVGVIFDGMERRQCAYAPLVIGADGRRSTVARRVGAQVQMKAAYATTCVYAYFDGLPNEGYQWFYEEGLAAGAIPTHDGQHCVFASTNADRFRSLTRSRDADDVLRQLMRETNPEFSQRLDAAPIVSKAVIFGGEHGFLRQATGPGWALVGDAGYFKDPLTAHGITDAFRDAECLSHAILSGAPLARFETRRNACSLGLFELTNQIASFGWNLNELKAMHLKLNEIMKEEQSLIANGAELRLAA